MANAKKCDRCGEFYILASEKIPDSNETFAYSNVIQDSVLEISYYPDTVSYTHLTLPTIA